MNPMAQSNWDEWEEAELVIAAKFGNLTAFNVLVQRYRRGATAQANAVLGRRELAEDAVQEAFLAAYKALPKLEDVAAFAGWLGAIVRHCSLRLGRGERRKPLPLDEVLLAHVPSLATDLEMERKACVIWQAIQSLEPDVAPVLQLYYGDDWPVARIAEFLGIPVTTAKWRLHAGRKRIRNELGALMEDNDE